MTTIYAKAQDQLLIATILPKVACNSKKSVKLHVNFDDTWDEYPAKQAVFTTSNDPTPYTETLSATGECTVPHEVLADEGRLFIYVKGINANIGAEKPTTPISYRILPGTPSLVVSDPSPSVYDKLLTACAESEARISNIIAHNNDTEGNTELIDIRKGLYGDIYATAGDAVRDLGDTFLAGMTEQNFAECLKIRRVRYYLGSSSVDRNVVDNCKMRSNLVDLAAYKAAFSMYGTVGQVPIAVACELNSPLPVTTDFSRYMLIVKTDFEGEVRIRFSSGMSWGSTETASYLYVVLHKGINIIPLALKIISNLGHTHFKYVSLETNALLSATRFEAYVVTDTMLLDYFTDKIKDLRREMVYVDLDVEPEIYKNNLECTVTYKDSLLSIHIPEKTTEEAEWRFVTVAFNLGKDIAGRKLLVRRNTDNFHSFGIGLASGQWVQKNFSTDHNIHEIDLGEFIADNEKLSTHTGDYFLIIGIEAAYTSTYSRAYNESVNIMEITSAETSLSPIARLGTFDPDKFEKKTDKYITCWGDSLTAGGGWTERLSALSGMPLYNAGIGGENARTITARQGADVIMVNNITIPASTDSVTIASYASPFTTAFGHSVMPLLQGSGSNVNPVKIGGIEGTLAWTGSSYSDTSGTWTFTRSKEGEEVIINRPTALVTAFDREKNSPHLMVIFMGQNGGYDSDNEELVNLHRLMINHAKAKHTIILGLSSGSATSRADYEAAMKKAFGRYFISLREYLSEYGLDDAGLTPTDSDTAAMATGTVPPQLLADNVHYTSTAKTIIGNLIYKRCCELGIFDA